MERKKLHTRRLSALLFAGLLWMSSLTVYAEDILPQAGTVTVTIYHTNDMHGALTSTESSIGVDKVAALRDATPDSILVDAGDATQGYPLASLSKGHDIIDIMNAAGYDLMAAGNHEFDYGTRQLLVNAGAAKFPMLAANVYSKDTGGPLLEGTVPGNNGCHTIIERSGVKIGFFGLTTSGTKTATNPAGIQDVEFKDEIETAKKEIDELEQEGADAIIAVAHLGEYTNIPCDSKKLAEAMKDRYQGKLDAIIDGHSHTVESNRIENGVLIQQTGAELINLGKITLTVTPGGGVSQAEGSYLKYENISVEPKAEVTAKIDEIKSGQDIIMSQPVCDVNDTLWGGYVDNVAVARITETNLGDFMADAYQDATRQFLQNAQGLEQYKNLRVLAVMNGGGIRAPLYNGTATLGDLVSVLPFSNTLVLKEVTPKVVYEMLERSVSAVTGQNQETGQIEGQPDGGFLHVSGFSFTYNPGAEQGSKIESVTVPSNGQDIQLDRTDDTTKMVLASNNFIMGGGSGYSMVDTLPQLGEMGGELETVQAYIDTLTKNGTEPLDTAGIAGGRINVNGGYSKSQYEAAFRVMENFTSVQNIDTAASSGTPAGNRQVSLYIDGNDVPVNKISDEQGIVRITLSNGPHSIALSKSQKQIYVNNYTGAGIFTGNADELPAIAYVEPNIAITVPSDQELAIAPGRSFYVRGTFTGLSIPDGSRVSVSMLDEAGNKVREISTDIKENKNLKTDVITYAPSGDDLTDSGMPDLIWDGRDEASFHLGDTKCYYDDNHFAALIPGGKTEDSIDDRMGLTDTAGKPYEPLKEGTYTILVQVESSSGDILTSNAKQITIGTTEDKILSRFSPDSHKDRITEFANDTGYRIYKDPFPGYWTREGQEICEIGPEWRAADATEYTAGNVHFIIYNVKESSTTYSVEIGLLQSMGDIRERLKSYYYTTGEPEPLDGVSSEIVPFASGDRLQIVRAETSNEKTDDGVYLMDGGSQVEYDMDVSDGINASAGEYIALYGVAAPIQINKADIRLNEDNTYMLSNRIETVRYHLTGTGIDREYEKEVRLNRTSGGKDNYSELEFKHVIPVTEDMIGKTVTLEAKAYDTHGSLVEGTRETIQINVAKEGSPNQEKNPDQKETEGKAPEAGKAPDTGDDAPTVLLLAIMVLTASFVGRKKFME